MDRSSAYIYGSTAAVGSATNRTASYDLSARREPSYTEMSSRTGRTRTRDRSADFSVVKMRRSNSLELSAPVKPRIRDRSTDFSINGIERISSRPKTAIYDSKFDAKEYMELTGSADRYVTVQKYKNTNTDIDNLVEEERRSKAYSKIINQSSSLQQEVDASRACMSDMFMNTGGFSTKTVAAIAKEVIYKEDKGPKNYNWRKEMSSYEEKLEVLNAHKKTVQESTRATRDAYRSTNSKIRDYDLESRKTVESDRFMSKPASTTISRDRNYTCDSTVPARKHYDTNHNMDDASHDYTEPAGKKGAWRKDLERYESELQLKKVEKENERKISDYKKTWNAPSSDSIPYTTSHRSALPAQTQTNGITEIDSTLSTTCYNYTSNKSEVKPNNSTPNDEPSKNWRTYDSTTKSEVAQDQHKISPPPKKYNSVKIEEEYTSQLKKSEATMKDEPKVETKKPTPSWKMTDPKKNEQTKDMTLIPATEERKSEETPKPTPKWKKPESTVKEEPKVETPKWKKPDSKVKEEPKEETPKPTPKWKKPEPKVKEEPKEETPKPTPKWKKPEPKVKEEPKEETPKPTPKWKKPETKATEEPKEETPKPTPKWKKPEPKVKEEPKEETPKPTPKWKKPETKAKEEPKEETPKPTPKWKKPETKVKETLEGQEIVEISTKTETPTTQYNSNDTKKDEEKESKPETKSNKTDATPPEDGEEDKKKKDEAKEEEEEEDTTGMKAMRKETDDKFSNMEAEFEQGRSKLAALRAKMKRLREASKAAAAADEAAEATRKG